MKGLKDGKRAISAIDLFPTDKSSCNTAFMVQDLIFSDYVDGKGLRYLDRNTKLALVAMKLAIQDAQLMQSDISNAGIVLGTVFGSISSISEFDREMIANGPASVAPMRFSNTVINSPASQVNIRYGINGMSTTISSGQSASLDAIGYATQFIRHGAMKIIFTGGSEELSGEIFYALDRHGLLAKGNGSLPFCKKSEGIILGEGAVFLVLEELSHALEREAIILAEVKGYSNTFEPMCNTKMIMS